MRAVAITTCCKDVFSIPEYLAFLRPELLVPHDMVASTPALLLYSFLKSSLFSHFLTLSIARYSSGCLRVRVLLVDFVHKCLFLQNLQSFDENFIFMVSLPLSIDLVQLERSLPSGHTARCLSISKSAGAKPLSVIAYQFSSFLLGPTRSTPYFFSLSRRLLASIYPVSTRCDFGRRSFSFR